MASGFNYFGQSANHAATYARVRPTPPPDLIDSINRFLREKLVRSDTDVCVDVGCGPGLSTAILAPHFAKVIGVDPSAQNVDEANTTNIHNNVEYRVSGAESLSVEDESVALVASFSAAHWFNLPKFYSEVHRVLQQNGVMALCGYNLPELIGIGNADAQLIIRKYIEEILGDYVLDGYRKWHNKYVDPEFNEVPFVVGGHMIRQEGFVSEVPATISEVTEFFSSLSAFHNYQKQRGQQAGEALLNQFQTELEQILDKQPEDKISLRYQHFLLMGRKA